MRLSQGLLQTECLKIHDHMFKKKLNSVRNKAQIRFVSKNMMPRELLAELLDCYLGIWTSILAKLWNLPKREDLETWLKKYQWDEIMFNV